ncbi:MAG TPA: aquaporin [Pirellulaceae bacterium]|nr:aquaporin [Pirellulaceae bacterium]
MTTTSKLPTKPGHPSEFHRFNDDRWGAIWRNVVQSAVRHWPEFLIEAASLGTFMFSACMFGVLLFSPDSPTVQWIPNAEMRRALMGLAMGLTAIGIIYSPWGKRSGAHMNPAVTLTFLRLGKVSFTDFAFYSLAHVLGALSGVLLASLFATKWITQPEVNYVATVPGPGGALVAAVSEFVIAFILMSVVLLVSNQPRWERMTGLCAGGLVALYIYVEAPLSGMSMNPARSLASAIPSGTWTSFWVYVVVPPLAMLSAAQFHVWIRGPRAVHCAKLHHENNQRCIFCGKPPTSSCDP